MTHDRLFFYLFSIACVVTVLGQAATAWDGHWVAAVFQGGMLLLVAYQALFLRRFIGQANQLQMVKERREALRLRFDPIAARIEAAAVNAAAPRLAREEFERAIAAAERDSRAGGPGLAPTLKRDTP